MSHWANDAIFYHIYPLGLCGAPFRNDFRAPVQPRLDQLYGWPDHLEALGINALYLGPLFESSSHGYDTADYYHVDRRLGDNGTLTRLVSELHQRGIRVILDGVFNHVGRDFWAFRDVLAQREQSAYTDWFHNLQFGRQSPYHDPFTYEGWSGHFSLVKLNLQNPSVQDHLLQAVKLWIETFDIDGLRLDTADCLDMEFLRQLAAFCRNLRPDVWMMGEVVHGDYRHWVNTETLDSVTNYECYKALYSSHVDKNYYELAYALNRQFGEGGLYRHAPLYAFADNHDVNRVASTLTNPAHLYPLYCLLMTMPGVPSVYYGSEWGIEGKKTDHSDAPIRPPLDLIEAARSAPHRDLDTAIARLAHIRRNTPALRYGDYTQLFVASEQMAFARHTREDYLIVAVNASNKPAPFDLLIPGSDHKELVDLLNPGDTYWVRQGKVQIPAVPPCWARILAMN